MEVDPREHFVLHFTSQGLLGISAIWSLNATEK